MLSFLLNLDFACLSLTIKAGKANVVPGLLVIDLN